MEIRRAHALVHRAWQTARMTLLNTAKEWARRVKRDVIALWMAARDPRTTLAAKIVAACVAAYALSPIDLIPDFVPVLGYLDDLLIVPLGIMLAVRLVPPELMSAFRIAAAQRDDRPTSIAGLTFVVVVWVVIGGLIVRAAWLLLAPSS